MHVPIGVFADDWERLKVGQAWGVLPGFRPVIGVKGSDDSSVVEAVVAEVIARSPAAEAGVEVGDRIRSFDGVKVNTFAELQAAVQQSLPVIRCLSKSCGVEKASSYRSSWASKNSLNAV